MSLDDLIAKTLKYTMLTEEGLRKLYAIIDDLDVPGAVVECGVASGGAAAFLWAASGKSRPLWMFDSWQGLPHPGEHDGGRAWAKHFHKMLANNGAWCRGEITHVFEVLRAVGCPLDLMHFCPGWFEETLPERAKEIGDIAILHLDGDFYESTRAALIWLWPYVVPGGVVIIDDYDVWPGCRKAIDEFCEENVLTVENGVIRK